jgi:hypothetical protein
MEKNDILTILYSHFPDHPDKNEQISNDIMELFYINIETELLKHFGFSDDGAILADNQLKIFDIMDSIKNNKKMDEKTVIE